MYYLIVSLSRGWAVHFGGQVVAEFRTHAEAAAFIKGRRSAEGRAS